MRSFLGIPSGLWGTLIILLLVIYSIDPPLSKTSKAYLSLNTDVSFNNNGAIYIAGINVPETIDPYEYGSHIYNKRYAKETNFRLNSNFENLDITKDAVSYIGENNLHCWYRQEDISEENCASETELEELIKQNSLLLDRYGTLKEFENFNFNLRITDRDFFKGQTYISLQSLINSQAIYLAQKGQYDEAFNLWHTNFLMNKRIFSQSNSLVMSGIITVGLEVSREASLKLFSILPSNKVFIDKTIHALLNPIFTPENPIHRIFSDEFNYIFDAFYEMEEFRDLNISKRLKVCFFYKPRATKNKYAKQFENILILEALSDTQYFSDRDIQFPDYSDYSKISLFPLPFYNMIGDILMIGVIRGNELVTNWRFNEIKSRLIAVALLAQNENIETQQMQNFLDKLPDNMKSTIDHAPFDWVDNKLQISVKYPEERVFEISYPLKTLSQ